MARTTKSVVRDLRKRIGMTQEEFAREVHRTWRTVSRWESGTSEPNPNQREELFQLALRQGHRDLAVELEPLSYSLHAYLIPNITRLLYRNEDSTAISAEEWIQFERMAIRMARRLVKSGEDILSREELKTLVLQSEAYYFCNPVGPKPLPISRRTK